MGRTAKDTAGLIEQVARGERRVEDIEDPGLRETVRLALRLYRDPTSAPDTRTRNRIRSRVLMGLRPRPATLADRVALTLEVLARPTPYAMRAIAVALIVACFGIGTTVASVASTPSDLLYSVKRASEQVRLALATTPEDRAGVQLSIAEHRLAEAATLASRGDDLDAVVLTSQYGEHLASAAAELAQTETDEVSTVTLVSQLQQKIDVQRATAAAVAARLGDDPSTASAAAVLAVVANRATPTSGLSPAAAIAAQAASAADEIATAAERRAAPPSRPSDARAVETSPLPDAQRVSDPRAGDAPRATSRGDASASDRASDRAPERAAEAARKAADEAKAAAQKAKESSRRTPSPTPRKR